MKLKIKDFQSISDLEVNFNKGEISCIVGESNQGKTAILRAIKAVLLNPQSTAHYIQHGKSKAQVTLENNNETLTWERTKSSNSYIYKDKSYVKASRQSSKDFCDLGFITDFKGNLVNLSDEWALLFPFGYTETELFKLFEDLFSIVDSAKILEGMKADETTCNRDKLLLQDKLTTTTQKVKLGTELIDKLSTLPNPELIKTVLLKKETELKYLQENFNKIIALNSILKLEVPSRSFNTDCLVEMNKQLSELYKVCSRLSQLPQNLPIPNPKYFNWDLESLNKINKSYADFIQEDKNATILTNSCSELKKELNQLQEKWNTIGVCPLCGKEME